MSQAIFMFGLPVVAFLALVLWPKGRPALWASLTTLAVLLPAWVSLYLDFWGFQARGDNQGQVFVFFCLLGFSLAWFLASSLQLLRLRFPAHWPSWSWPAVAFSTLGVIGFGIYRMIGL